MSQTALSKAKQSIVSEPSNYHQISQRLLQSLYPLTPQTISLLLTQLQSSELPQHKLLFFYSLELLLVNNCSNFRTNKLAAILNLQYATEMQKLDLEKKGDLLTGAILTVIHSASLRNARMLIPEMVGFVLGVCAKVERDVRQGGANGYKVREFGEALDSIMIENRHESHILLHSILKVLDGLLISNPKLYNLTIFREDLKQTLQYLKKQLPKEPYLDTLPVQLGQTHVQTQVEYNEPEEFKQLTPRFSSKYVKEQSIKDLKKKRVKMQKRLINDMRNAIHDRMLEQQIKEDVRNQRIAKKYKKELYVIEKQTAEARKIHRKLKRFKQQSKDSKGKQTKKVGKKISKKAAN